MVSVFPGSFPLDYFFSDFPIHLPQQPSCFPGITNPPWVLLSLGVLGIEFSAPHMVNRCSSTDEPTWAQNTGGDSSVGLTERTLNCNGKGSNSSWSRHSWFWPFQLPFLYLITTTPCLSEALPLPYASLTMDTQLRPDQLGLDKLQGSSD